MSLFINTSLIACGSIVCQLVLTAMALDGELCTLFGTKGEGLRRRPSFELTFAFDSCGI